MFALRRFNLLQARTVANLPIVSKSTLRNSSSATPAKPSGIWGKYLAYLEKYPLTTKCLTSAGIAFAGDVSCQKLFEDHPMDWSRCTTFTILGGVWTAPALHFWYGTLGRVIQGNTTKAVLQRLAADQFLFAPTFVPSFFAILLLVDGKPEEIPSKVKNDWWPTIQTNWSVWIPAQFINFKLIPPHLQVLFANCVGLAWNSYMSFMSYRKVPEDEE